MNRSSLTETLNEMAWKAAAECGVELVHTEIAGSGKKQTVRIFIDRPDGITHDDCSDMSNKVGQMLDETDLISSAYTLEVSSPGIERGLYSLKDFEKFAGSSAKVKTNRAINGQRNFRGKISGVENEKIVFDDKTNGIVKFNFNDVAKARLEIDFDEELKKANSKKT